MNFEHYKNIANFLFNSVLEVYKESKKDLYKKAGFKNIKIKELKFSDGKKNKKKFGDIEIDFTATDKVALDNFRVECFKVAGVGSYDLEEKLKQLAIDLQEGKHPLNKKFPNKNITNLFEAEAQSIMSDYLPTSKIPPGSWLATNLNTAMNSSYSASQWITLQEPGMQEVYPYLQYLTMGDNAVRPAHQKLHKRVWLVSDSIWSKIMPPNGWNCRCITRSLMHDELDGATLEITGGDSTKINEIVKDGGVEKDFQRNPGQIQSIWSKWLQEKMSGKNYEEISNRLIGYANKMPDVDEMEKVLNKNASEFRSLDYTIENFYKEFPENKVETPLGEVELGGDFFTKLGRREKRIEILGLVKPILQNPEYVIVDIESGTLFLKGFKKRDEDAIIYASVLKVPQGGDDVLIISTHKKDNWKGKVKNGKLLIYSRHMQSASPDRAGKQFTSHTGGLNLSIKLTEQDKNKNGKIDNSGYDEIWGDLFQYKFPDYTQYYSIIYFIKYKITGIEVLKRSYSSLEESIVDDYINIDKYRKGVLINV
ncbi:MAG TPA: phage minor head protein [Ignavibacteria bacterium]|nr:phage minor head protein [Ignavibacteria bacterium]